MARENEKFKLGNLQELSGLGPEQIPVCEFAYMSDPFPVEDEVIDANYGDQIDPLQVRPKSSRSESHVTSLIRSQTVEEFIYASHVGVVVIPDPKLFSLNGADVAVPSQATTTPAFDGFVPPSSDMRPAQLVWGHHTQRAAWALLNAYDLSLTIGSRYEVFREPCANVGACIAGNFHGFGHSLYSPVADIREQNDMVFSRAKGGAARAFIPQTVTAATGQGNPTPAEPPLVDVAYGGVQMGGVFGGWYPLNGLLLAPGLPINLLMERTRGDAGEGSYHAQMVAAMRDQQRDTVTYSSRFQEKVADNSGDLGFAGARLWKAGLFRVGILIRGVSLGPLATYQAYQDMGRYLDSVSKAVCYRDSASSMIAMASKVAGLAPQARVGGETFSENLRKAGGKIAGVQEIDEIDFRNLYLPTPLVQA